MPSLEWIGKKAVLRHHREVPFRLLEPEPAFSCGEVSGNLLVRGDNLDALKALLPRYAGRVKCIYIDPPYNTGNEGWRYNDNVNSPEIRQWLGEVVGKEGETLDRHDRWLCMMYPRLVLLRRFLCDDGVIFISIDDNEQANLKLMCDEIFGGACFAANIAWQRTYSPRNDSQGIVTEVEHMLVYGKQPGWRPKALPRTAKMNAMYTNPDNDAHPWTSSDAFAPGAATHQGMVYALQHPFTGKMIYPGSGRHWTFGQDQVLDIMREWCCYELQDLHDEEKRAMICGVTASEVRQSVQGVVLSEPLDVAAAKAQKIYDRGQWPRFFFTKGGKGGIRRKIYLENVGGKLPTNLWPYEEAGHTDEAKKQLLDIFGGKAPFDTPKPIRLLERILRIATEKDSIVLDSFAGSGATAHAVLKQNAADGGRRRFILVEMDDGIAEKVTARRLKSVIEGYTNAKGEAVPGLGGGFQFCRLSQEPLFTTAGEIRPDVTFAQLAEFVWFQETGAGYAGGAASPLLGVHEGRAVYLLYNGILKDKSATGGNVLTQTLYRSLPMPDDFPNGPKVVYAAASRGEAWLRRENVIFKQTPYALEASP